MQACCCRPDESGEDIGGELHDSVVSVLARCFSESRYRVRSRVEEIGLFDMVES
jgi:hypothetical protein